MTTATPTNNPGGPATGTREAGPGEATNERDQGAVQRSQSERNLVEPRPQEFSGRNQRTSLAGDGGGASLTTDQGRTKIANGVVAKIAGLAARDIPGVYSMGAGMSRRMGQIKSLMPGATDAGSAAQGVSVEVGEREAAVDLDVVTWYGQSIVEVTRAVREHVIEQVEGMTGLKVVEVNISVDDIHVESDSGPEESRVQ